MKLPDSIPVSVSGYGERESTIKTEAELTSSIKNYYEQLKAPYLSSQIHIKTLLEAENAKLRDCQSEVVLSDKRSASKLKVKANEIQFEISDIESGLRWAASKVR